MVVEPTIQEMETKLRELEWFENPWCRHWWAPPYWTGATGFRKVTDAFNDALAFEQGRKNVDQFKKVA